MILLNQELINLGFKLENDLIAPLACQINLIKLKFPRAISEKA